MRGCNAGRIPEDNPHLFLLARCSCLSACAAEMPGPTPEGLRPTGARDWFATPPQPAPLGFVLRRAKSTCVCVCFEKTWPFANQLACRARRMRSKYIAFSFRILLDSLSNFPQPVIQGAAAPCSFIWRWGVCCVFACPSRNLERPSLVCLSWGLLSFSRTELVSLSCVCPGAFPPSLAALSCAFALLLDSTG